MISKSVGSGGFNVRIDVILIQTLLNIVRIKANQNLIAVDGLVGPQTIGAITGFQRRNQGLHPDGRVDPGRATETALIRQSQGAPATIEDLLAEISAILADADGQARAAALAEQLKVAIDQAFRRR